VDAVNFKRIGGVDGIEGHKVMRREYLEELCRRLIEYDRDIVEIIQFGSSVYAPEYSRDVDLMVITKKAKEYSGYFDIANPRDAPINVDILVFNADEKPKEELLRGALGAFKILYGSGEYLLKYAKELSDPTFEEARSSLRVAASLLKLALETVNPLDKDRICREAFDALFHAARIASMVYLSTEISRWGLIKRELPEPYRTSFNDFISTLHIKYFYNGEYPRGKVEGEFNKWFRRVEEYISKLELEAKIKRR
jgi:predicted nucleotidyltransferase